MKKIIISVICLFFMVPMSLSDDRKSNRGFSNRSSGSDKTTSGGRGNPSPRQSDTRREQPAERPASRPSAAWPERAPAPPSVSKPDRQPERKPPAAAPALQKSSVNNNASKADRRDDGRRSGNYNQPAQSVSRGNPSKSSILVNRNNEIKQTAAVNSRNIVRSNNTSVNRTAGSRSNINAMNYSLPRNTMPRVSGRSYHTPSASTYRYYKPYSSASNTSLTIRSAVRFLLFPFGSVTLRSGYYPHHRYYYSSYRYYYPYYYSSYYFNPFYYDHFYARTNVSYNNYYYNTYSYENNKLAPDPSMLQDDSDQENDEYLGNNEIEGIKLQNTRFTTANNNSYIGFVINNDSKHYISSISFKIAIRTLKDSETIDGIFYKLDIPLEPYGKKYYQVPLDGELQLPDSYSVFAALESITTTSGVTIDR